MPRIKKPELRFPIKLTPAQRKDFAEVIPSLADRLKLDEPNQRNIDLSLAELKAIKAKAETAVQKALTGRECRPIWFVIERIDEAITQFQRLSVAEQVYQFKITLLESHPPIWRRIQVEDCTLDKLHEHIQTAMGWTNSHLHQFQIKEQLYGDPMLMEEDFQERGFEDSTTTMLSEIMPKKGKRFRFQYEYDFGDSWHHEILFEGVVKADPKAKYPLCLEGERACPPEDCGGIWGYASLVEAVKDKKHEQHEELLNWVGGRFNPAKFDPAKATKTMRKGLPDWRRIV